MQVRPLFTAGFRRRGVEQIDDTQRCVKLLARTIRERGGGRSGGICPRSDKKRFPRGVSLLAWDKRAPRPLLLSRLGSLPRLPFPLVPLSFFLRSAHFLRAAKAGDASKNMINWSRRFARHISPSPPSWLTASRRRSKRRVGMPSVSVV